MSKSAFFMLASNKRRFVLVGMCMPVPMPRGSGLILTWLPVVCRYTSTASGFGRTVYRVTTTWARASEITTVQTSNLLYFLVDMVVLERQKTFRLGPTRSWHLFHVDSKTQQEDNISKVMSNQVNDQKESLLSL